MKKMLDTFASRNSSYLFDARHHPIKKAGFLHAKSVTTGNGSNAKQSNTETDENNKETVRLNVNENNNSRAIIFSRNKPTSLSFKSPTESSSSKVNATNRQTNGNVALKRIRQSLYFPNSKYEFYRSIAPTTTTTTRNVNEKENAENSKTLLNLHLHPSGDDELDDEKMDIYEISTVRSNSNLSSKFQKLVKLNENANKFVRKLNGGGDNSETGGNYSSSSGSGRRPLLASRQKTFAEYGRSRTVARAPLRESVSSLSEDNAMKGNNNNISSRVEEKTSRSVLKETQSAIKLTTYSDEKKKLTVERSKSSLERDYKKYKLLMFNDQHAPKRLNKEVSEESEVVRQLSAESSGGGDKDMLYDSSYADLESSKIKLKNNIQSSFLTYGSTIINPFVSNFDIVNKSNPNFYKNISASNGSSDYLNRRFNRANTSLSLMSSLNEFRTSNIAKPTLISSPATSSRVETKRSLKNQASFSTIQSAADNVIEQAAVVVESTMPKPEEKQESNPIAAIINPLMAEQVDSTSPTKKKSNNNQNSNPKNDDSTIKQNIFLSYRTVKKESESEIRAHNRPNRSAKHFKQPARQLRATSAVNDGSKVKSNDAVRSSEPVIVDSSEMYVDAQTYTRIRSWLENVDRVQRVEGKWLNTISNIAFYD